MSPIIFTICALYALYMVGIRQGIKSYKKLIKWEAL